MACSASSVGGTPERSISESHSTGVDVALRCHSSFVTFSPLLSFSSPLVLLLLLRPHCACVRARVCTRALSTQEGVLLRVLHTPHLLEAFLANATKSRATRGRRPTATTTSTLAGAPTLTVHAGAGPKVPSAPSLPPILPAVPPPGSVPGGLPVGAHAAAAAPDARPHHALLTAQAASAAPGAVLALGESVHPPSDLSYERGSRSFTLSPRHEDGGAGNGNGAPPRFLLAATTGAPAASASMPVLPSPSEPAGPSAGATAGHNPNASTPLLEATVDLPATGDGSGAITQQQPPQPPLPGHSMVEAPTLPQGDLSTAGDNSTEDAVPPALPERGGTDKDSRERIDESGSSSSDTSSSSGDTNAASRGDSPRDGDADNHNGTTVNGAGAGNLGGFPARQETAPATAAPAALALGHHDPNTIVSVALAASALQPWSPSVAAASLVPARTFALSGGASGNVGSASIGSMSSSHGFASMVGGFDTPDDGTATAAAGRGTGGRGANRHHRDHRLTDKGRGGGTATGGGTPGLRWQLPHQQHQHHQHHGKTGTAGKDSTGTPTHQVQRQQQQQQNDTPMPRHVGGGGPSNKFGERPKAVFTPRVALGAVVSIVVVLVTVAIFSTPSIFLQQSGFVISQMAKLQACATAMPHSRQHAHLID